MLHGPDFDNLWADLNDLISTLPPIPNLTIRLCQGEVDYPAIVDINNLSWHVDDRFDVDTLEQCRAAFANIANFDITQDALMVEIAGQAVAYAQVQWGVHEDGRYKGQRWFDVEATVVPQWRRKDIGRALQTWLEARVRAIAATALPVERQYMSSFTRDKAIGRVAVLQRARFSATDFWYGMERSLAEPVPDLPLPDGLQARPARPDHFRQILAAHKDAAREMPGDMVETTDIELAEFINFATDQLNQYELWQIAWDGDQIVGMVLNNIDVRGNLALGLNRGFTDPIAVRHAWRRRGLAKALIARSLVVLREKGVETAFLGVDTQNPNDALRLYESMGFVKVKSATTYQKML